jgi:outer membrane biosynthesis protein TonB
VNWASNTQPARRAKAFALSLTVLAHLAVLASVGRHGPVGESAPRPGTTTLVVALLPATAPVNAASDAKTQLPAAAVVAPPTPAEPEPAPQPEPQAEPLPAPQPEPLPAPQPALRYFQSDELTEQPSVASGLARGRWLVLPGAADSRITARFWINETGDVVRVQLVHSDADEEEKAEMLAALQQVRFHPAHMGHLAVHSEVQMDLRVVSEVGL